MKLYFVILALLFSTILATAQPDDERNRLKDFNLKGKVKSFTEKQYFAKKNGKTEAAPFQEITYYFNEKGLVESWESKDNQDGTATKSYDYDENGQATFMTYESFESFALRYVFEQKGKTLWQNCYWKSGHGGKIGNLHYKLMFTKDNSNRLIEYAKFYGTRTDFNFKEVYTYNTNNEVGEMKYYGLTGNLNSRYTYTYDKNNNQVEEKRYSYTYKDNELFSMAKFEYKYDSNNNWTEMFKKVDYGKGNSIEYKKTVRIIEYY